VALALRRAPEDEDAMTRWGAAAGALLLMAWLAAPADASIIEVTTTVSVTDAADQAKLREAIQLAVDGALKDAIAFTPTLIVLTRAVVVGDRVHVRLLVADQEGERAVKDLTGPGKDAAKPADLEI
jgi:hypothetical protein